MFQSAFIFLSILVGAAFQVSFLPHFFPSGSVPDFLLILIIFWVVRLDFSRTFFWVIISGVVLDAISLSPLGLHVLAFVSVAFLVDYLAKKIIVVQENRHFFVLLGLLILGTFLNDWILIGFNKLIVVDNFVYGLGLFFGRELFLKVLYNLIIFSLVYWPLVKLDDFFSFYSPRISAAK
jgi:rod shape-determining protein MreD